MYFLVMKTIFLVVKTIKIKYKHFEVVSETKKYLVHSFRHSLNITIHFCIITEYLKLLTEKGMIFCYIAYINYHQLF